MLHYKWNRLLVMGFYTPFFFMDIKELSNIIFSVYMQQLEAVCKHNLNVSDVRLDSLTNQEKKLYSDIALDLTKIVFSMANKTLEKN